MKKEDRQIVWRKDTIKHDFGRKTNCYEGFMKEIHLFDVIEEYYDDLDLYLRINGNFSFVKSFSSLKSAKRGAERFLKRLQEAVK